MRLLDVLAHNLKGLEGGAVEGEERSTFRGNATVHGNRGVGVAAASS